MSILVVEDDQLLNHTLCYNLTVAGYVVDEAFNLAIAKQKLLKQKYDLIILDVNLPDGSGFDFCKEIKERKLESAIIFLTAHDLESDQLRGFELGADDYVVKPFPMSVFQKKVTVLLSRLTKQGRSDGYDDGYLVIHFANLTATLAGKSILFTPLEYRLLKILTQNCNIVLTRQTLLERLWDIDENYVDEHALTSTMSRVRNKIELGEYQYLKTVLMKQHVLLKPLFYPGILLNK